MEEQLCTDNEVAIIDNPSNISDQLLVNKKKLIQLAKEIINLDNNSTLRALFKALNLTEDQVIESYVNYNLDISSYGNEIYNSLSVRASMYLLSLLKGSWHQERQNTVIEFINACLPNSIIDMGFGQPTLYVKKAIQEHKPHITLCDFADSAFIFAETLLNILSKNWHDTVSFKRFNMESGEYVGDYDLYIFLDSIEHITQPHQYLSQHVKSAPDNSNFLISLPIGPITPSHHIAWETIEEARNWIHSCNLNIQLSKVIHTNPEVDIFANIPGVEYLNLFLLCNKRS